MKSMADALTEALKSRMSKGGNISITISSDKMGLAPDVKSEDAQEEKEWEEDPAKEMAEGESSLEHEKEEGHKDPEAALATHKEEMEEALMGQESPEEVMKGPATSLSAKVAQEVAKKKVKA